MTEISQLRAKVWLAQVAKGMPWYDSLWLSKYLVAQKIIKGVRPGMLPEFVNAFARLKTRASFEVQKVEKIFDDGVMDAIREVVRSLPAGTYESHEVKRFGRHVVHNHPFLTDLQKTILPIVSELAGENVEPCYNFLCLYLRFGVCEPHIDAPEAKWTLDLCIDQSDEWPIHFSQIVPWPEEASYEGEVWQAQVKNSPGLQFTSHSLRPNEALLFSGSSQWHYRDSLKNFSGGGFCNLVFFHFIPEGMSEIVRPKNWAKIFAIPELEFIEF